MKQSKLLAFDAFAKTVDDARVRTASGGIVTITCLLTILMLVLSEWRDFNTVVLRPELVVDRDRSKRLDINLDITFPKMPCDVLTLDIMDVSGELQVDIASNNFQKIRLDQSLNEIGTEDLAIGGNSNKLAKAKAPGYCGPCYGAKDQAGNDAKPQNEKVCCNTCEDVKQAYVEVGWAFFDGKNIEQCEEEGYVTKINERINEGCRIKGTANINRVAGNLHIAPGGSFTTSATHIHDLSLYEKHPHLTLEHMVNHFSFGPDPGNNFHHNSEATGNIKELMFSTHPLDGFSSKTGFKRHVYSYFMKVVSTRYEFLNHTILETNQFSATKHDRPLAGGKDEDHQHTVHSRGGHPAVFFNMEISPIKVINREEYAKSWGSFVLSVCSAIGGVLTIGAVLDKTVYEANKVIRQKKNT